MRHIWVEFKYLFMSADQTPNTTHCIPLLSRNLSSSSSFLPQPNYYSNPTSQSTMAFFFSYKRTMRSMTSTSSSLPPVLSILYSALLLLFQSAAYSFPLLLLATVSSSYLFSCTYPTLFPILSDLVRKICHLFKPAPIPPNILTEVTTDLRFTAQFVSVLLPVVTLSSLLILLSAVTIFSYTYTESSLSPQTLVKRVVSRGYQTAVTGSYVVLLTLGYSCLSFFSLGMVYFNMDPDTSSQTLLNSAMSMTGVSVLLYFYLLTRWSMAMVITVIEETWGIGALSWSVELFIGNKMIGTALTFFLMAARMAIYGSFAMILSSHPPIPLDEQVKIGTIVASVGAVLEVYCWAAYTVFYYYCRKSHGLDQTVSTTVTEEGFMYSSVPLKTEAA